MQPEKRGVRILVTVADGDAFTLVEVALLRPDEVDGDLDLLADELLPQEFLRFLRVRCLSRVRRSTPKQSASIDKES